MVILYFRLLKGKLINKSILCESLSGIEIPVLTITDKNQNSDKNVIVISARIHPGESNSSWIMQVSY